MNSEEKQPITAFVFDFETGGLDCKECACTQIALHAIRIDTFERIDKISFYIKPYNMQEDKSPNKRKVLKSKYDVDEQKPMLYEQKALEYSAITMDMLNSMGKPIEEVASEIIDFMNKNSLNKGRSTKPFLIGQNVLFDIGFLQQLMIYGGKYNELQKVLRGCTDYFGNFQPYYIDTMLLGNMALSNLPGMTSYKLEIMCERLGIELDDAHDADADVTATEGVACTLATRMRNVGGGDDGEYTMNKGEKTRVHFKI